MKEITCVVIGGEHAGIQAVHSILKASKERQNDYRFRIILMDKETYHLRKVLLFKPAAGEGNIKLPLDRMFPNEDVRFVQGTVLTVESENKTIRYQDANGKEHPLVYDYLVVTVGSVIQTPDLEQGGIALTGLDAAARIQTQWRENIRKAARESNVANRQSLLTVAVAGAGISGIETSAELAQAMRAEAVKLGLDQKEVKIYLINSEARLFHEGPIRVSRKLERVLHESGIEVLHQIKALHEKDGTLTLSDGRTLSVGLCIWTLGLKPNPNLRQFSLPLTTDGQIIVDASYRVQGASGIYSIGDCARIIDPTSGQADQKTCKEASAQAVRLGKIIIADLEGRPAPTHKRFMDFFCFGLGPNRGMVWTRQWGLDIIITGKLGWKIRQMTWDMASLIKS